MRSAGFVNFNEEMSVWEPTQVLDRLGITWNSLSGTLKIVDRRITKINSGKWFEPRSLSRLCGLIVRVRVVPRRTVVGDIDRRFDNLSGGHHQSHVNCVSSVYGIYVSGQLSRDVIGCFKQC